MKYSIFLSALLFISACFPSMQTGPDPHSIDFKEDEFQYIVSYFNEHPNLEGFKLERPPKEIPEAILEEMEDVGFLEFRNLGEYKVFFCGYGVVGKGWGFIYGDIEDKFPTGIQGNERSLSITYLQHLKGKWYRFGA